MIINVGILPKLLVMLEDLNHTSVSIDAIDKLGFYSVQTAY
jgi:hypothetical protein